MRKALAATALIATLGTTAAACPPPPSSAPPALCGKFPSGRIVGTLGANCNPNGPYIAVNVPCGPLTATTAEDDACVRFYNQNADVIGGWPLPGGETVIGPLSAWNSAEDGPPFGVQ